MKHKGPNAFTETPAIVQAAPPASPLRFYARLRHQLESRGLDYDNLPRLTPEGGSPPCFKKIRVSFDAWLAQASLLGATVPYRYGMPAEPNYCWDCTKTCQAAMIDRGLCNFPNVRFETSRNLVPDGKGRRIPEKEVLGVTRVRRLDVNPFDEYDLTDTQE